MGPTPVLLDPMHNKPENPTTVQPLQLTDFFGTPEPLVSHNKVSTKGKITSDQRGRSPLLFDITNDISSDFSDDLFEKLQTLTGATAVGVTRDRAVTTEHKSKDREGETEIQQNMEEAGNEGQSADQTASDIKSKVQVREKKKRRRGRFHGRRKVVDRVRNKQEVEKVESVGRQGKAVSFVKAPLPP